MVPNRPHIRRRRRKFKSTQVLTGGNVLVFQLKPRPQRRISWPTSDQDLAVLSLEQAAEASSTIHNAIILAQLDTPGCAFCGGDDWWDRAGVRAWVYIKRGFGDWLTNTAHPICRRCWGYHGGDTGCYFAMRHRLYERADHLRRRRQRLELLRGPKPKFKLIKGGRQ
jgi:hypothetical protein